VLSRAEGRFELTARIAIRCLAKALTPKTGAERRAQVQQARGPLATAESLG
jgi:hypothetical protein